ncbi:hypothetical protein [Microbacterium aerolatum]|uniref:hypothetical protein n=2 Tax=Microbacterium aerolatum TaxID=153731 RepID=UPI00384A60BE
MSFDMDLQRDAEAAFGAASITSGALLPFEGRTLMRAEDGPPPAAIDAQTDGWLSKDNPVLVHGSLTILPLAWAGDGSGATPDEIAKFASQMQAAGMQWAGNWRVLNLDERRSDSIGSYTTALRAAGATEVDCWTYSETVGIALVLSEADAGAGTLALHIVPSGWVSDRRAGKPVRGIDARWSWADVVALFASTAEREAEGATATLAGVREEEQSS